MPNSYTQLYIHHVSAVKYRHALILPEFETRLYKYIMTIGNNLNQTMINVNGMPDHIHILARLRPDITPSSFVQKIKSNSSRFINENKFLNSKFAWQTGGGTFSVSRTHVDIVNAYISNQKNHHKTTSLKKEYINLLKENKIEFEEKYLPDFFD